ncbi:YncE family protein [Rhodococcus sp. NPDC058514]|uniref:YncE family protein n=1 Tax=unclassified Rhodococcus (in: high G+C Gram-positive bacteria) TaxID=192944 RepID=UPI0036670B6A
MRVPAARTTTVLAGALLLLVTGCSSDSGGDKLKTIEPATAAASPATVAQPAGTVRPLPAAVETAAFDPTTGTVALLTPDAGRLLLLPAADPAAAPREVPLPGGVASLGKARDGVLVVPAGRAVVRVDLASGQSTTVEVDGDVRSAAFLGTGDLAVGTADGSVLVLDTNGQQTERISGLASVDALGVTGEQLTALDRRQTSVTEIDIPEKHLGRALRAGEGATNLTTDHFGRVLVTDTRGGELIALTTDPLMMRQRFPVPNSPYGIAFDDTANLVWVTLTGSNEVVGYDLSSGIPVEKHRFATVRQPNAVTVDPSTGTLFVGSAVGDGLQSIDTRAQS